MKTYCLSLLFLIVFGVTESVCSQNLSTKTVTISIPDNAAPRVEFGVQKLRSALEKAGIGIGERKSVSERNGRKVTIGLYNDPVIGKELRKYQNANDKAPGKEGYVIRSDDKSIIVAGFDESGILYGCLELADKISAEGALPVNLNLTDQPEMVLRGTCIGIQKTEYLPGRTVYEYPYTPENFPWLYDKELWIKYLDMLVENRLNSLYLWNGHPFASLVKLKDYPYAVEVDEQTFKKNEELYSFLTTEADKRGIWVIQMFYNIIVSKPFAEKHNMPTQERKREITPLLSDYTRKSIAAFVEKYPNVGLLITLGEAMEGDENDVEWFTKTIIPGVKDGLAALGSSTQPPIVLRGHDTNPQLVMKASLPLYNSLFTMNKYNGEALTTYQPRGPWTKMHREMSALGSTHIDNVHILANLEPFRYGSADFIQKSVQAMHDIHGANGLHLYPESSYWDWPYTADHTSQRLLQIDRDWVWYKAWARYAWNCRRDRKQEIAYWGGELGDEFGAGQAGKDILEAYEQAGEIAPKLLRRFGITNGNRQTLTLGMTMSQLVNPKKYRVWPELYNSDGPEGETLTEYVDKELQSLKHIGETPVQIIAEVVLHGKLAADAIDRAASHVTRNKDEFGRVKNDVYCTQALADFFSEKVKAAALVLTYTYTKKLSDLEAALPHLEQSVDHYKRLVELTKDTYLYANSMQTAQRRIPVGGDGGKNKTWVELLPFYQKEVERFKINLRKLKAGEGSRNTSEVITPISVALTRKTETFQLKNGEEVYKDTPSAVKGLPDSFSELQALRFNAKDQYAKNSKIEFETDVPVKLLVGYFQSGQSGFLSTPNLETDATANDYGEAEVQIAGAFTVNKIPVNIHVFTFPSGKHTLVFGKGKVLVLGFTDTNVDLKNLVSKSDKAASNIDWLFEED
ncbi:hypothetical protein DSL64_22925 [Dyadobacter luteus]|uniref:Beta-hexosaminidase bacterial type N-terminal domain-containing protein n=1 Tax=Dyadobacter luteus TaxID=2259619 RepID=A0A3D8Y5I7_9BACT|nr:hypothetical protein [Dyadobacter luteus]REA57791.1 hypothetical protein DSL64_22925 [Dyadobacter luteus]